MYQITKTEVSIVPSFVLRWDGAVCPIRKGLIPWLSQLGVTPVSCSALLVLLALTPPAAT